MTEADNAEMIARFLEKQAKELRHFAAMYRAYESEGLVPPGAPRAKATRYTTRRAPAEIVNAALDEILDRGKAITLNDLVTALEAKGLVVPYNTVYKRVRADKTLTRVGRSVQRIKEG